MEIRAFFSFEKHLSFEVFATTVVAILSIYVFGVSD